jgi:hypothetical protein
MNCAFVQPSMADIGYYIWGKILVFRRLLYGRKRPRLRLITTKSIKIVLYILKLCRPTYHIAVIKEVYIYKDLGQLKKSFPPL